MTMAPVADAPASGRKRIPAAAAGATIALILTSAAFAQPRLPAHPSYLAVGGDDDTMLLVDTRSMTKDTVWLAYAWREPQAGGEAAALTLQHVDCAKGAVQETYRAAYDVDGRLLGTNAVVQASQAVEADSQLSSVLDFVCRATKLTTNDFRFRSLVDARAW